MARWKKPTREETRIERRNLAAKASAGELRLPAAVSDIRHALGMTQVQFSEATGLTKRQIAEIEAGKANPTLATLERIGRLFGFAVGFVPEHSETAIRRASDDLQSVAPGK